MRETMDAVTPDTPRMDVPYPGDVTLTGEIQAMAEGLTETERNAIIISNYRMLQEITGFVRDLQRTMDRMANAGGIQGMMARNMLGGSNVLPMFPPKGRKG